MAAGSAAAVELAGEREAEGDGRELGGRDVDAARLGASPKRGPAGWRADGEIIAELAWVPWCGLRCDDLRCTAVHPPSSSSSSPADPESVSGGVSSTGASALAGLAGGGGGRAGAARDGRGGKSSTVGRAGARRDGDLWPAARSHSDSPAELLQP